MNGQEMMLEMTNGGCFRRQSWPEHTGIFLSEADNLIYHYNNDMTGSQWQLNFEDIESSDWERAK